MEPLDRATMLKSASERAWSVRRGSSVSKAFTDVFNPTSRAFEVGFYARVTRVIPLAFAIFAPFVTLGAKVVESVAGMMSPFGLVKYGLAVMVAWVVICTQYQTQEAVDAVIVHGVHPLAVSVQQGYQLLQGLWRLVTTTYNRLIDTMWCVLIGEDGAGPELAPFVSDVIAVGIAITGIASNPGDTHAWQGLVHALYQIVLDLKDLLLVIIQLIKGILVNELGLGPALHKIVDILVSALVGILKLVDSILGTLSGFITLFATVYIDIIAFEVQVIIDLMHGVLKIISAIVGGKKGPLGGPLRAADRILKKANKLNSRVKTLPSSLPAIRRAIRTTENTIRGIGAFFDDTDTPEGIPISKGDGEWQPAAELFDWNGDGVLSSVVDEVNAAIALFEKALEKALSVSFVAPKECHACVWAEYLLSHTGVAAEGIVEWVLEQTIRRALTTVRSLTVCKFISTDVKSTQTIGCVVRGYWPMELPGTALVNWMVDVTANPAWPMRPPMPSCKDRGFVGEAVFTSAIPLRVLGPTIDALSQPPFLVSLFIIVPAKWGVNMAQNTLRFLTGLRVDAPDVYAMADQLSDDGVTGTCAILSTPMIPYALLLVGVYITVAAAGVITLGGLIAFVVLLLLPDPVVTEMIDNSHRITEIALSVGEIAAAFREERSMSFDTESPPEVTLTEQPLTTESGGRHRARLSHKRADPVF